MFICVNWISVSADTAVMDRAASPAARGPFQAKWSCPLSRRGVEEADDGLRGGVPAGDVRPLEAVAIEAAPREVVFARRAVVLFRNYDACFKASRARSFRMSMNRRERRYS